MSKLFSLYEDLPEEYQDLLDEEMSEEDEQLKLMQLQEETQSKVEKLIFVKKSIDPLAEAIKAEEKRLAERRKALENKAERIKLFAFRLMEQAKLDKIKTSKLSIWVQNNPESLEILDSESIPEEFLVPQPPSLDKKGMIELLKTLTEDEIIELGYAKLVKTRGIRFK